MVACQKRGRDGHPVSKVVGCVGKEVQKPANQLLRLNTLIFVDRWLLSLGGRLGLFLILLVLLLILLLVPLLVLLLVLLLFCGLCGLG